MTWRLTLSGALEAVQWHRLRSLLTVVGILIGITAVMVTVGIGEGAQATVAKQIESLGSNLLTITPGSSSSTSGVRGGLGSATTLTVEDAKALSSATVAPAISEVAPIVAGSATLTHGTTTWTSTIDGSTPSWLSIRSRSIEVGRFITNQDNQDNAPVIVLGALTAQELFGAANPIGQTVTVKSTPMTVIGVLTPVGSGSSAQSNQDDLAVVPLTTSQIYLAKGSGSSSLQSILVKAKSAPLLSAAYQEINHELLMLHQITNPTNADFTITAEQSIVSAATSVSTTLTYLLGSVAAISLLVGGIGVMNIMLVSVTERTREIGLRKALGATRVDIRRQFLVEAAILGFTGGAIGVALGEIGQRLLPRFIGYPISIPAIATLGSLVVAIGIGIGFGVYPAARAARLSPLDALRSE